MQIYFYFWSVRKLIAVILLLVFLVNLSGVFIAFKIQQVLIRNEVIQLLKNPGFENELTVITVTSENKNLFEWENDHEFRYNGMMYDVVQEKNNTRGELQLDCFADEKETGLWVELTEVVKKNGSSHEALKNLFKLLGNVFLSSEENLLCFSQNKSIVNFSFTNHHLSQDDDVLSPPPRLGC